MRRRDYYWSLFQKSEKRQIDDLRTEYVEVVFEVLPKATIDDWLVWREGFRSWKPLSDFPALLTSLREGNAGGAAQPAPPQATEIAEKKTSVQTRLERASGGNVEAEFAISDESGSDDRDTRYPKKWEVRIQMGGGKPVINQSVDVSNKGIHLRDPLPRGLPNYFNVELKTADSVIPLICSEIQTADGSASKRLRIEVNHHAGALTSALLANI
jgi:hypothetical protein